MIPEVHAATLLLAQAPDGATMAELMEMIHQVLNFTIFSIGDQSVTVVTVIVVGLMLLATWWISAILQRAVDRALRVRGVEDEGTAAVTKRLAHYGIMALGLAIAVDQVGIDLTALFAAGALFAVGIGFAMQNIAQNFVSGLILLIERVIKPADVIQVEGEVVRIQKMGIRTTVARTRNDEEIIIPNSTLVQSLVKNFTMGDSAFRVRVVVGVSYGSDMRRVRAVLERVAADQPWRLQSAEPVIFLLDFGTSSVDWEVSVWCNDAWLAPRAASDLREGIWNGLKDEGIVIAFPQLDLHLDSPVEEALARLPRSA